MSQAVVYKWDACSDSLSGLKNATKSYFKYPRKIYKLYKSAEIHIKQSFKLPLWLLLPFISIVLGIYSFPKAYAILNHSANGQGLRADAPVASAPVKSPPAVVNQPGQGAAAFDVPKPAVQVPVPDTEQISACIASAKMCRCYNHNGIHLPMTELECRYSAQYVTDKFRLTVNAADSGI